MAVLNSAQVVFCSRGIWGKGLYFSSNPNYVDEGYSLEAWSEVDQQIVRCGYCISSPWRVAGHDRSPVSGYASSGLWLGFLITTYPTSRS